MLNFIFGLILGKTRYEIANGRVSIFSGRKLEDKFILADVTELEFRLVGKPSGADVGIIKITDTYGYRMYLEDENALLVVSEILKSSDYSIEQLQYERNNGTEKNITIHITPVTQ
jgi:hypothetical protein